MLLLTLSLITAAFVAFIYIFFVWIPRKKVKYYEDQGAHACYTPIIGRLLECKQDLKNHNDFYYSVKRRKWDKNPPKFVTGILGINPTVYFADNAMVKEFFVNSHNYRLDPRILGTIRDILGNGLLMAEGQDHKLQRKIISSVFHFEFLRQIVPSITDIVKKGLNEMEKTEDMSKVSTIEVFQLLAGDVVAQLFFGEQVESYSFKGKKLQLGLANLFVRNNQISLNPLILLLGPKFLKISPFKSHKELREDVKEFRSLCLSIVRTKKEQFQANKADIGKKPRKDLLDALFLYLDSSQTEQLSETNIVDQFITFFMAGMDTTAHFMNIAIYLLHQHPNVKQRILDEVNQYYSDGEQIDLDKLSQMDYLTAFIKESLRFMTPVPSLVPRIAIQDHEIQGIKIKKGTYANVQFFGNLYDPNIFENPSEFNPQRFIDKPSPSDPFAYTPFAAGHKNCIGQHLFQIEAKITICEFVRRYDFELQKDYILKMGLKFLPEPVDPIVFNIIKKKI